MIRNCSSFIYFKIISATRLHDEVKKEIPTKTTTISQDGFKNEESPIKNNKEELINEKSIDNLSSTTEKIVDYEKIREKPKLISDLENEQDYNSFFHLLDNPTSIFFMFL